MDRFLGAQGARRTRKFPIFRSIPITKHPPFATNFQHYHDHLSNGDTAVGGAERKQLATSEEAVEGRTGYPILPNLKY